MAGSVSAAEIAQVRAFNRDYTRQLGVLARGFLDSPYSLTQVRVLYEIAHRPGVTAAELAGELGLDRGYLSRILKGFEARRLLQRATASEDGRRQHLKLTAAGQRVFAPLERRSQEEVRRLLSALDSADRQEVLDAMCTLQQALGVRDVPADSALTLRGLRPGDLGWVIERHGALYAQEFGWNEAFEALVARIAAEFIDKFDAARERCWIAERDGRRLGCVFLVAGEGATARLRLLLVEPAARGMGLGARLIAECVRFAAAAGYERITLWTHQNLRAARRLYERAGFVRTREEPAHSFGADVVSEIWELRLDGGNAATHRSRDAAKR
jgi:DNA-binding MarR family transcriptional regulator/ribosomal protein S18 acetylase RimI-like enzyme